MKQQIKLYEHVDTICEMVKPKINGRKICVLYFNQNDKTTLEPKFDKNGLKIDYWINESITAPTENDEFTRSSLSQKANEFYIIIWKPFDQNIYKQFTDDGYKEVSDFLFFTPKRNEITGNDSDFSDEYGNVIKNLPVNVTIVLTGYLSKVEFLDNNKFAGNNKIILHSKALFKVGSSNLFRATNIILNNSTVFKANNNNIIGEISFSTTLDTSSMFEIGSHNRIRQFSGWTNGYNFIKIGDDTLFSSDIECTPHSHPVFDVLTGEKRNLVLGKDNQIIIGDHVWIGKYVSIMFPCFIGSGSIVGLRSVVKGKYPNNVTIAGMPGRVVRKNSAWANWGNNISVCGNSYAIPTIEFSNMQNEKLKQLYKINDIYSYLEHLNKVGDKFVVISVKDAIGQYVDDKTASLIAQLGFKSNLRNLFRRSFIGILNDNKVVKEQLAEEDNIPLEYEGSLDGIKVKVVSKPSLCGNISQMFINGFDYSANYRGINIAVYDKLSKQLADSVAFDTFTQNIPCIRKISTY